MATNKFATMLHRNTNKITLVLVYAILEWILIILLLLNSLFSYLIIKFADYFGLKRPCMWCARIDHIIESEKNLNPCRDLVCETHAVEISKLGFCLNHHKLAESDDMCEDCLSSFSSKQNFVKVSQNFDFFPWMKEISMIDGVDEKMIEKAEEGLKCSCCGVNFDNRFYPPCIVINPSMKNILDYEQNSPQKQNLIKEGVFFSEVDHHSDQVRSDFGVLHHENQQKIEEKSKIHMLFEVEKDSGRKEEDAEENCACSVCDGVKETMVDDLYKLEFGVVKGKEENLEFNVAKPNDDEVCDKTAVEIEKTEEIPYKHLEFFIHGDDCSLIPVELVESTATENENQSEFNKAIDEGFIAGEDFILDFGMNTDAEAEPLIEKWHISGDIVAEFSCQENKNVYKVNEVESEQLNYRDVRFSQIDEDLAKDDNVEVNIERMMNGYGDGELGSYVSLG
jgi:hypothetical protein